MRHGSTTRMKLLHLILQSGGSRRSGRRFALALLAGIAISSLQPWAVVAAAPAAPSITVTPDPITPYLSSGCSSAYNPCYLAEGSADPGAKVTVTVTDDIHPDFSVTATTYAKRSSDPGDPAPSGQAGYWVVSPDVTELGSHDAEPALLTFTAQAEVDGILSASASIQVTKRAHTAEDSVAPRITFHDWPPENWCHTGFGTGCTTDSCHFNNIREATRGLPLPVSLANNQTARGVCLHYARIQGVVDDNHDKAAGIASEVADVLITITSLERQESWQIRSFIRSGTRAFYSTVVSIDEFEPGEYEIRITSEDAGGLQAEAALHYFTVYAT